MPKDKQIKLDPMEWRDAMKDVAPAPGKKAPAPAKKAPAKKKPAAKKKSSSR
jgi:hypothetical protein